MKAGEVYEGKEKGSPYNPSTVNQTTNPSRKGGLEEEELNEIGKRENPNKKKKKKRGAQQQSWRAKKPSTVIRAGQGGSEKKL